jgi:predicted DNA-binding protein (UPF0251 family)
MPRPKLCRKITFNPNITYFKPQGVPMRELEIVELTAEEIEAYRLRHVGNLEQMEAAKKMRTSQSTYQRILYSAYRKIADALTNGKAIKIKKQMPPSFNE